jgi:hypothetical protein
LTLWLHAQPRRDVLTGLLVLDESGRPIIDLEPEAEAAAGLVAETLLMWRAWLKSKFEK